MSEVNFCAWTTMDDKLVEFLIFKLDFIRKISDFLPDSLSDQEQEILNLLKQHSDYDFAAQIVRKIQRKYSKNWF